MSAVCSYAHPVTACIIGATGGIGGALVRTLVDDPNVATVCAGSRQIGVETSKIRPFAIDLLDEASIAAAAQILQPLGPLNLIMVATGQLHDGTALQPEKSFRSQSNDAYARAFAINATGPALVAKHFLPLLPREGRSVFAVLSARVGSISDNRLGGWHAYRASKAALNMIMRNLAIELARTHKDAIAVPLHPGTVATALSEPFQKNVAQEKLFPPEYSAARLLSVINGLSAKDSGAFFAWDGERIAF